MSVNVRRRYLGLILGPAIGLLSGFALGLPEFLRTRVLLCVLVPGFCGGVCGAVAGVAWAFGTFYRTTTPSGRRHIVWHGLECAAGGLLVGLPIGAAAWAWEGSPSLGVGLVSTVILMSLSFGLMDAVEVAQADERQRRAAFDRPPPGHTALPTPGVPEAIRPPRRPEDA